MSKIRLLTKDELFDNPLEIIQELGRKAFQTEFESRMTGGQLQELVLITIMMIMGYLK